MAIRNTHKYCPRHCGSCRSIWNAMISTYDNDGKQWNSVYLKWKNFSFNYHSLGFYLMNSLSSVLWDDLLIFPFMQAARSTVNCYRKIGDFWSNSWKIIVSVPWEGSERSLTECFNRKVRKWTQWKLWRLVTSDIGVQGWVSRKYLNGGRQNVSFYQV